MDFFPSAYHAQTFLSHTKNIFRKGNYEQSQALAYFLCRLLCLAYQCSMRYYACFLVLFAVERVNRPKIPHQSS